jgi:hypothetical protein
MEKLLLLMMITVATVGAKNLSPLYAQITPLYADSTKIRVFGKQMWSDVVRIPGCNKTDFTASTTDPYCRSHTENGNTWYYYNWAYVDANKSTLCPLPWRVPTKEDFDILLKNNNKGLGDVWGYGGGLADGSYVSQVSGHAYYWSSTKADSNNAYSLSFSTSGLVGPQYDTNKRDGRYGFQVRCVIAMPF